MLNRVPGIVEALRSVNKISFASTKIDLNIEFIAESAAATCVLYIIHPFCTS